MTDPQGAGVTVLGLGAMGSALATTLLDAGHAVTVWNRTSARAVDLSARGAQAASSIGAAVAANPLIVACLLDHASVHETLDPVIAGMRGSTLVNLTTTTPNEARELATWAAGHGVDHLDGAIMATPPMIGTPEASILYSGSRDVFDASRPVLDRWATSTYDGADAGLASLVDLAMLSGMYSMFAGFLHGAAMAGSVGISATEFAARATPFLSAMTDGFEHFAGVIDGGDYAVPGQQSLDFSDLSHIVRASEEQGVRPTTIAAVQELISEQIADGHGAEGFARIYESLRAERTAKTGQTHQDDNSDELEVAR
ncbi:NAD(P)-dependent oxidoreductase [Promicromonospora iranensis]|uniref:3-hydroxyisobutyrate dehydrogenase-like beta-hydroxyacid dehydrogenase n=1 Tax=Promicromonospora iranensis TaxID=1105144 RepID=A0ABU2CQR4_9MICO|nr:NAD(P)-dependent oxidoreductase [Promicromonospora iranensis]MDR7383611.1 3-hydroxyisobutyrate dehydrogenase-like beta-hydroxyacid dehydrogenase [Promicromonospora iranensis]